MSGIFYDSLSCNAKELYLKLWDLKRGCELYCKDYKKYGLDIVVDTDLDGKGFWVFGGMGEVGYAKSKEGDIPKASLELCIGMIEKLGYLVDSRSTKDMLRGRFVYRTYIMKNTNTVYTTEHQWTRIETLQEALKWALESEAGKE